MHIRQLTVATRRAAVGYARFASSDTAGNAKTKVLVVGGGSTRTLLAHVISMTSSTGTGGLTVANQIFNRFKKCGKPLNAGDITILDSAYVRVIVFRHYFKTLSWCPTNSITIIR